MHEYSPWKKEYIKLILICFNTPLNESEHNFTGLKNKQNNYIDLNILTKDLNKYDKEDIQTVLFLYSNPDKLYNYCKKTIEQFLKTLEPLDTNYTCIYEYGH